MPPNDKQLPITSFNEEKGITPHHPTSVSLGEEDYDSRIFDGLENGLHALPSYCGDEPMNNIAGMIVAAVDMLGETRCVSKGIPSVLDTVSLRVCLALLHELTPKADPSIRKLLQNATTSLDVALQIRCGELTEKGRRLGARHLQ
ncbi:MAG: hypothetical protein ACYC3W_12100 [Candidatus Nanopelagicales bacterium]